MKTAKNAGAKKIAAKTAQKSLPRRPVVQALPELYYRGHALLNTVRCIAQHEDRLCVLLHEIKRRGTVGAATAKELRKLLEEMPAEEYAVDLRSLQDELN